MRRTRRFSVVSLDGDVSYRTTVMVDREDETKFGTRLCLSKVVGEHTIRNRAELVPGDLFYFCKSLLCNDGEFSQRFELSNGYLRVVHIGDVWEIWVGDNFASVLTEVAARYLVYWILVEIYGGVPSSFSGQFS